MNNGINKKFLYIEKKFVNMETRCKSAFSVKKNSLLSKKNKHKEDNHKEANYKVNNHEEDNHDIEGTNLYEFLKPAKPAKPANPTPEPNKPHPLTSKKINKPAPNSKITNTPSSSDTESVDSMESIHIEPVVNKVNDIKYLLPVSIAESVTAGALSNTLCSEPGSSMFFLGGIVAYNMQTQEKLLNVNVEYAELNNFANPFTTLTMAKNVTQIFNSRIGLSTTGFSLPTYREANPEQGKCEIDVKTPYAYVCLYDAKYDLHKIYKIVNDDYRPDDCKKIQRAKMQAKVALKGKIIFDEYCKKIYLSTQKQDQ